jgi:coproporphyrinogen III oxidase-like Fe-S oxidoreductase
LLTQRELAKYLVSRGAHYHFTAKLNQRFLLEDIARYFQNYANKADYTCTGHGEHGRIETRQIWRTTDLNSYLNFPHVGQAFMIKREAISKKSGEVTRETIYGITVNRHSKQVRVKY